MGSLLEFGLLFRLGWWSVILLELRRISCFYSHSLYFLILLNSNSISIQYSYIFSIPHPFPLSTPPNVPHTSLFYHNSIILLVSFLISLLFIVQIFIILLIVFEVMLPSIHVLSDHFLSIITIFLILSILLCSSLFPCSLHPQLSFSSMSLFSLLCCLQILSAHKIVRLVHLFPFLFPSFSYSVQPLHSQYRPLNSYQISALHPHLLQFSA